jgi:hypothetical protein
MRPYSDDPMEAEPRRHQTSNNLVDHEDSTQSTHLYRCLPAPYGETTLMPRVKIRNLTLLAIEIPEDITTDHYLAGDRILCE